MPTKGQVNKRQLCALSPLDSYFVAHTHTHAHKVSASKEHYTVYSHAVFNFGYLPGAAALDSLVYTLELDPIHRGL